MAAVGSDLRDLGQGILCIDLLERGLTGRSAAYLVDGGREFALIETGGNRSFRVIRRALELADVDERQVRWIVVSHIHLDHAGGLGQLLKAWPWAKAVVHPAGVPHVINPEKLVASSRPVYGQDYDALWGTLVPAAREQVMPSTDGQRLRVGSRELIVLHTPGHAAHHLVVEDPDTGGLFTGDAAGIRYARLSSWHLDVVLPSTSPPRFDPASMSASLHRLADRNPKRLYYTHFGMADRAKDRLLEVAAEALRFGDMALAALKKTADSALPDDLERSIREAVAQRMQNALHAAGAQDVPAAWEAGDLSWDFELNVQGLVAYARYCARHPDKIATEGEWRSS